MEKTGRHPLTVYHSLHPLRVRSSAALILALWQGPAFFHGCTRESAEILPPEFPSAIAVKVAAGVPGNRGMDLFFFDADGILDSYQRFDGAIPDSVEAVSGSSAVTAVAVSGFAKDVYEWSDIRSISSLESKTFPLSGDNPSAPLLSGTAGVRDGSITLRPSLVRIRLNSISCDFSGTPYAGETLKEVRAYLTGVSSLCRPLLPDAPPDEWMNLDGLDSAATASLPCPEMLLAHISDEVGRTRIRPVKDFFCYGNPVEEDSFGRPVTKLVIEGKIGGITYYYPIPIPGIKGGDAVEADITITRRGSTDPSTPAQNASLEVTLSTADWTVREETVVSFSTASRAEGALEVTQEDLNLWVFDAAGQLEFRKYVKNTGPIRLSLLRWCPYTLFAVVGAGYELPPRTLAETEGFRFHLAYPDEFPARIPSAAMVKDFVRGDMGITDIPLRRIAAAVDVTMDRSGLDDGIVLKVIRAELVNCPRSVALFGESRALDSGDLFSAGYTLSGEGSAPLNTVDPEGRSGTVRLYGPENLLEGGKLATYLRLDISYNGGGWYTGAGEYLIYRIRLNELRRSEILPITVRPVGTGLNPRDPWMIDKGALRPAGNI